MRHLWAVTLLGVGCGGDGEDVPGERFEFQGAIHTVAVTAASGSVALKAKSGPIVVEFTPTEDGDNFQFDETTGRLVLGSVCKDGSIGCGTSIDITLPPGTDFEVTTTSGPVSIVGMDVLGWVETTSGPILGTDLGPMILETRSLTGNHDLTFDSAPNSLQMDGGASGNLRLTMPAGDYRLDISAGGSTTTTGVQDGPSGPDIILNTGGNVTVTGV